MHSTNKPRSDQLSTPELLALAQLSPVGGVESIAFTILALGCAGWLFFASSLQPSLGGLGAFLAILSAVCMVERVCRPLVLCALGRHVYQTLVNIAGKSTADDVARFCVAGQAPSRAELESLLKRSDRLAGRELGSEI